MATHAFRAPATSRAAFDRIAHLAARLVGAPKAWIASADLESQTLLGSAGLGETWRARDGHPPTPALNRHVVASGSPLAMSEMGRHPVDHADPNRDALGILAYLGVPWIGPRGVPCGALCVADIRPRGWAVVEIEALGDLAASTLSDPARIPDDLGSRAVLASLKHESALMGLLSAIAVASNEAATPADALRTCLERVCHLTGWPVGHACVRAKDEDGLISSGLWHTDDPGRFEPFRRASQGRTYRRGGGLPGVVLASGHPLAMHDLDSHPQFLRAHAAAAVGLRAGFAFPVLAGAEVVAVLEFFSLTARAPDDAFLEVMASVGTQLGRVFERERAAESLRAGEAKFRLVADTAPVIIGMTEPGREGWSYLNRTGLDFFGRVECEAGGLIPANAVHPADRAARAAAYEASRSDRRPMELESRHRRADGAWRWLAERSVPRLLPDGAYVGHLTTMTDVSGLKEFEEALRSSEEHKRRLVESSRDCLRELSPEGLVLSINEAGRELTEAEPRGPLLGKPWVDSWPIEGRAAVRAAIKTARGGGVARFQGACPTERGMPRWWDVIVAPVRDAEGRTERLLSTARDITALKQAESDLRRSREQFRGAFDAASIGMALVAPDGRWLQVNRALSEIVGFTEAELLATTFQALTHTDDLDDDLALTRRVLDGEIHSYQLEKRYLHKRGHVVWILLSVSLVRDDDDRPLYFVSQVQDISRWKGADEGSPQPGDLSDG